MATSSSKAPCATCGNKAAGIFRCEGCVQVFCRKHLLEHRDLLSHQLDEIVIEHDTLQQTIVENKGKQNNQHPVLKQIDQWEKDSIMKIRQVAEEARQQLQKLTSSQAVPKELHELAQLLQRARTDDDYVETDLRTWSAMLQKLKDDINRYFPVISIHEDRTQILVNKMHVAATTATTQHGKPGERFGESLGSILIDDNGLLATHNGAEDNQALVRGIGEYSSGKHSIRFLFKKNSTGYLTSFTVVSKLMPLRRVKTNYTGYGWSSGDDIYCFNNGMLGKENFRDMNGQTTFEIELQLDCDRRKISYINQGTKNRREMNVDISKCPFPWQVEFYLYEVGDCVTLLPSY